MSFPNEILIHILEYINLPIINIFTRVHKNKIATYRYNPSTYFGSNIKKMVVDSVFIKHNFSDNLQSLIIYYPTNDMLEFKLPKNLTYLCIESPHTSVNFISHDNIVLKDCSLKCKKITSLHNLNLDSINSFYVNYSCTIDFVPKNVTKLICSYTEFYLPDSLLEINFLVKRELETIHLPSNLKILNLYNYSNNLKIIGNFENLRECNCYDSNILPIRPNKIQFRQNFNSKLIGSLPESLLDLRLVDYNHYIDFSNNLQHLNLGNRYNYPIDFSKLGNLISLVLSDDYSHFIDFFPDSLNVLILGNSYNHKISKLPNNLKVLKVKNYGSELLEYLPASLECFVCKNSFNISISHLLRFKDNLTSFIIDNVIDLNNISLLNDLLYKYQNVKIRLQNRIYCANGETYINYLT